MMANYEIVEFIAMMQRLIINLEFPLKASGGHFNQTKKIKENLRSGSELHFCFLFLNWKVLSSKTFTVFF